MEIDSRLEIILPGSGQCFTISASQGEKISHAIWLSGYFASPPLCNGLGLCGKCRCKFLSPPPDPTGEERSFFASEELAQGWRLGCHHVVPPNASLRIELPRSITDIQPPQPASPSNQNMEDVLLGIDLGTTTVQWEVLNGSGACLSQGSVPNPQAPAGGDVISRLEYSLAHHSGNKLSALVQNAISNIILAEKADNHNVEKMCIAANSVMTEIFLEKDLKGLAAAPYTLSFTGNQWINLELPLLDRTIPTYFPKLIAPFVGADITAGLAFLVDRPCPFILSDLGTNAEIALLTEKEDLYIVSAPLGPALEGIGPINGQCAEEGVITGFKLAPDGLTPIFYRDRPVEIPSGISATGYISLLAILLKLGILSAAGQLDPAPGMPLARRLAAAIHDDEFELPFHLRLTLTDIEILLKIKAAFSIALARLLEMARLGPEDLAAFYISGNIGDFLSIGDLATLGFIPQGLESKIKKAGNTALAGACALVQSDALRGRITRICEKAICLNLTDEPDFMRHYLAAMRWGDFYA